MRFSTRLFVLTLFIASGVCSVSAQGGLDSVHACVMATTPQTDEELYACAECCGSSSGDPELYGQCIDQCLDYFDQHQFDFQSQEYCVLHHSPATSEENLACFQCCETRYEDPERSAQCQTQCSEARRRYILQRLHPEKCAEEHQPTTRPALRACDDCCRDAFPNDRLPMLECKRACGNVFWEAQGGECHKQSASVWVCVDCCESRHEGAESGQCLDQCWEMEEEQARQCEDPQSMIQCSECCRAESDCDDPRNPELCQPEVLYQCVLRDCVGLSSEQLLSEPSGDSFSG